MLIIPIGQEQDTVRRTPWVSYSLLAVNFFIALILTLSGSDSPSAWIKEANGALLYLYEHPYLAMPPTLNRYLDDEMAKDLMQARTTRIAAGIPSDATLAREQAELDAR